MLPLMQNFPFCIHSPPHYWFLNYIAFLFLFSKSVTVGTDTKSNQTIRKPSILSSYSAGWWITSQPLVLLIVMKSSPELCFLILKVLLWKNYTDGGNTSLGILWHSVRVETVTSYWPKYFYITHWQIYIEIYVLFNTFSFMSKTCKFFQKFVEQKTPFCQCHPTEHHMGIYKKISCCKDP